MRTAACRISLHGGRPDEAGPHRCGHAGHGDLWLETRQLAALPEALDAPFLVRTPVIACPSTVSVERAGTHVIASLTTTSLPPAVDGGYLEGGVTVFIGPGEASRVAHSRHNPRRSLAITRVAACNEKPSMNADNGARRASRGKTTG